MHINVIIYATHFLLNRALIGLINLHVAVQSWDEFFRSVSNEATPGLADAATKNCDHVLSHVSSTARGSTCCDEVPSKLIDDYLALQSIIREYQVDLCLLSFSNFFFSISYIFITSGDFFCTLFFFSLPERSGSLTGERSQLHCTGGSKGGYFVSYDPTNIQQTSSKCIQNTRANTGRLLDVCWIV